jgi:hypothetical protein
MNDARLAVSEYMVRITLKSLTEQLVGLANQQPVTIPDKLLGIADNVIE